MNWTEVQTLAEAAGYKLNYVLLHAPATVSTYDALCRVELRYQLPRGSFAVMSRECAWTEAAQAGLRLLEQRNELASKSFAGFGLAQPKPEGTLITYDDLQQP